MNALVWLLAAVSVFLLGRSVFGLYDDPLYSLLGWVLYGLALACMVATYFSLLDDISDWSGDE